jgi:hypothetical protein
MRVIGSPPQSIAAAAQGAVWMALVSLLLTSGCAEKVAEKSPEDFEKAREEHFEMMRRESGQAPSQPAAQ